MRILCHRKSETPELEAGATDRSWKKLYLAEIDMGSAMALRCWH